MEEKKDRPPFYGYAKGVTLGLQVAVGIAVLSWLGYKVDEKFHTEYWTLVGMLCGLLYGAYEFWKAIKDMNKDAS